MSGVPYECRAWRVKFIPTLMVWSQVWPNAYAYKSVSSDAGGTIAATSTHDNYFALRKCVNQE